MLSCTTQQLKKEEPAKRPMLYLNFPTPPEIETATGRAESPEIVELHFSEFFDLLVYMVRVSEVEKIYWGWVDAFEDVAE